MSPGVDPFDLADDEVHPVGQKDVPRPGDLVGRVGAERKEEEARLVAVDVVPVDDRNLPLVGVQFAAQFVDDHRAGGAPTENH